MTRHKIADILTILWLLNLIVALLVIFTGLSLKPYRLFYLQTSFFLTGLPLINWYNKRTNSTRRLAICLLLVFNAAIVTYYLFFDFRSDWKTQTIEYQHNHNTNRTIEFQLQDKGARGYNRRRVDKVKLLPFIEWTTELSAEPVDTVAWKKVSIDVNEMGLKGG